MTFRVSLHQPWRNLLASSVHLKPPHLLHFMSSRCIYPILVLLHTQTPCIRYPWNNCFRGAFLICFIVNESDLWKEKQSIIWEWCFSFVVAACSEKFSIRFVTKYFRSFFLLISVLHSRGRSITSRFHNWSQVFDCNKVESSFLSCDTNSLSASNSSLSFSFYRRSFSNANHSAIVPF